METHRKMKILITGASRGLGHSLARILAENLDFHLVLAARDVPSLQKLKSEIEKTNPNVEIFSLDLTRQESIHLLLEKVKDVDILVNNAAEKHFGRFLSQSKEELLSSVQVNCMAPLELCHHYAKSMKKKNTGLIINISSVAAFFPLPYLSVYGATKAFLLSLGESLDEELVGTGVRVMTVCPGVINTDFHRSAGLSERAIKKYSKAAMSSDEVAQIIADHIQKPQRIIVPGFFNKALTFVGRFTLRSFNVKSAANLYKEFLD